MKCLTYGYVVVFYILLTILLLPLLLVNTDLYYGICGFGVFGMTAYWLYGFIDDCADGYFGDLQRKK